MEYDSMCYLCRIKAQKDPAGIGPFELCNNHYKSECLRLYDLIDKLKYLLEEDE